MKFLFVFFLLFILNCACGIYIPRSTPIRKRNRLSSIQKETCTCFDENGMNFSFVKNVNESHEKMTYNCECVAYKREPDWFSFTFFIAFIIAMFCI